MNILYYRRQRPRRHAIGANIGQARAYRARCRPQRKPGLGARKYPPSSARPHRAAGRHQPKLLPPSAPMRCIHRRFARQKPIAGGCVWRGESHAGRQSQRRAALYPAQLGVCLAARALGEKFLADITDYNIAKYLPTTGWCRTAALTTPYCSPALCRKPPPAARFKSTWPSRRPMPSAMWPPHWPPC